MSNEVNVEIYVKRVGERAYVVTSIVNDRELVREFNDCNSAYAVHVVLRNIVYSHPNSKIVFKTNANTVLDDIREMDSSTRPLTKYLRIALESNDSQIIEAVFSAN